jgi:ubiquinone/menaquinone biosynthesis C-methylase UbiE
LNPVNHLLEAADNLSALDRDGYIIVDLLSKEQVQSMSELFREQYSDQYKASGFDTTMNMNHAGKREETDRFIKANFSAIVKGLLPGYRILFGNFLLKRASDPHSAVGIHRDWTYVDESLQASYNLWVPLTGINTLTGRFFILPGSHKIRHGPRATPFSDDLRRFHPLIEMLAVPLELEAGQAVLYHSGLIHFSEANQSGEDRPAIGMVNIPEEATNYHFHRLKEPGKFHRYAVDDLFYYHFNPTVGVEQPYSCKEITCFDAEEATGPWLMDYAKQKGLSAKVIAGYYDTATDSYLQTYGEAIQAFRPGKISELYQYLIKSIGLHKGMSILDAGCGVGGPAVYFAKKMALDITGITLSGKQVQLAKDHAAGQWWMKGHVHFLQGDFHALSTLFPDGNFDGILYLESLGHSYDLPTAVQQAFSALKPGGFIYIKDFFPYDIPDPEKAARYQFVVDRINTAYAYNVIDLNDLLRILRQTGFEIQFIRKFDFEDDIKARAAFEHLNNIDLFGYHQEFRVAEWLEIKCFKPRV